MALPLIPVLGAVVEFLVANGTRAAITKFGQQAVKQATKQMSNVQKKQAQKNILNKQGELNEAFASASARAQQLLSKQRPAPRFNQAERIRGQEAIKVKGRNKRIEGQAPSRRFDAEGDLIDEIPLRFAEGDVVQGIGSLIDGAAVGGAGRAISDMDRMMADQGARQSISAVEQRANMLQKTLGESGRTISNEDLNLFAMGEISFEDAISRARPNMDMVRAERNEMQQQQLGFAKGGEAFPDLTGDGQVTQADILKGRGVYAEGGDVSRETIEMEAQKAGMPVNEVDQALSQIEAVEPEMEKLNEMVAMVMQMIQSGASEEEIIMALQQMGLDQEDIQAVFEAVMEAMEVEQAAQSDPIQAELSQMA